MASSRLLRRALSIVSSVVRLLLSLKKLLVAAIKESRMQGPIIKEHVTNGSLSPGQDVSEKYGRIQVKLDGRRLRVYVKGTASSTGTIGWVGNVLPTMFWSDIDPTAYPLKAYAAPPVDAGGTTDYTVQPQLGNFAGTTAAINQSVYVSGNGSSGSFEIFFEGDADTSISNLYIVTELV
tara:strand:+ start:771 stop:1307 length:537 start_codon:yes stop_codon:yes gene_type:complete